MRVACVQNIAALATTWAPARRARLVQLLTQVNTLRIREYVSLWRCWYQCRSSHGSLYIVDGAVSGVLYRGFVAGAAGGATGFIVFIVGGAAAAVPLAACDTIVLAGAATAASSACAAALEPVADAVLLQRPVQVAHPRAFVFVYCVKSMFLYI